MPASQELLVFGCVTRRTVLGRQMLRDDEALMVQLLLSVLRLMTVEAIDPFCRMSTCFELVNHRGSLLAMAFCAFSGGLNKARRGLPYFHLRSHGV